MTARDPDDIDRREKALSAPRRKEVEACAHRAYWYAVGWQDGKGGKQDHDLPLAFRFAYREHAIEHAEGKCMLSNLRDAFGSFCASGHIRRS